MSNLSSPVELPTTRQSRHFHQVANIHDPNWIPVLNKTSPRSQNSTPYVDGAPQFPSRGSSRPVTPKDGPAQTRGSGARSFPQELEGAPIPPFRPRQASLEPRNKHMSRDTEDTLASSGDDTVLSADAPSTAGTGSLLEHQTYGLPKANGVKEARSFTQPAFMSDRGSVISSASKRPAIPTSKYNRKPAVGGSNPGTPVTASPTVFPQTMTDSPQVLPIDASQTRTMSPPRFQSLGSPYHKPGSPVSQYHPTQSIDPRTASQLSLSSHHSPSPSPAIQELAGEVPHAPPARLDALAELPNTPLPQIPPEPARHELPTTSKNRKSTASVRTTASVRKKRALHSHPSNPSMRSDKAEAASTVPITPQNSAFPGPGLVRTRTNESKRSVPAEGEPPTEAPSAPLPDLPSKIATKRPSTRQTKQKPSEGNLSLFPQQTPLSHSPSVLTTTSRSDAGHSNPSQFLSHSPSAFSIGGSTANPSSPPLQHRHNKSESNSHGPHKELANFMTSKSTLIFRRFDDMHVKLLLSIQDEIAVLERELLQLEAASEPSTFGMQDSNASEEDYDEDEDERAQGGQNGHDEKGSTTIRRKSRRERPRSSKGSKEQGESREMRREKRKVKIMAELRRLLAEYDHLYSNWTLMQKSSASQRDRRDLERYLTGDIATSESAREDLLWVERNASDLSCVNVGAAATNADTTSDDQRSRAGSLSNGKALSWGKKKGKSKAKGLGLQLGSSPDATSTSALAAGDDEGFYEKSGYNGPAAKTKGSSLGSWFGACVGRRK